MAEQEITSKPSPELPQGKAEDKQAADATTSKPPSLAAAPLANIADLKSATKLTAEEEMARFEDELKETDWGHQPC